MEGILRISKAMRNAVPVHVRASDNRRQDTWNATYKEGQ